VSIAEEENVKRNTIAKTKLINFVFEISEALGDPHLLVL